MYDTIIKESVRIADLFSKPQEKGEETPPQSVAEEEIIVEIQPVVAEEEGVVETPLPSISTPFHFSKETFKRIFPRAVDGIYEEIGKHLHTAGCITKAQQAMFLAQCAIESRYFTRFNESMDYSVEGLMSKFPKRITPEQARLYGRIDKVRPANQQMIANIVYANRNGNKDVKSGDGNKYRGKGIIQITFHDNYVSFNRWLNRKGVDVVKHPQLILNSLELIVLVGVWYWESRKLSRYSTVREVTYRINGGYNHLKERTELYEKLMSV